MIIGRDLMIQLGMLARFKCQVLCWDGVTVPMTQPRSVLGKSYLNVHEMHKVSIQTTEPVSTIEATERLVKTLDSVYEKANLKEVAYNTTQMNAEDITQLLRLLEYFEGLFDGTLGYWYTYPVNLELNL